MFSLQLIATFGIFIWIGDSAEQQQKENTDLGTKSIFILTSTTTLLFPILFLGFSGLSPFGS